MEVPEDFLGPEGLMTPSLTSRKNSVSSRWSKLSKVSNAAAALSNMMKENAKKQLEVVDKEIQKEEIKKERGSSFRKKPPVCVNEVEDKLTGLVEKGIKQEPAAPLPPGITISKSHSRWSTLSQKRSSLVGVGIDGSGNPTETGASMSRPLSYKSNLNRQTSITTSATGPIHSKTYWRRTSNFIRLPFGPQYVKKTEFCHATEEHKACTLDTSIANAILKTPGADVILFFGYNGPQYTDEELLSNLGGSKTYTSFAQLNKDSLTHSQTQKFKSNYYLTH